MKLQTDITEDPLYVQVVEALNGFRERYLELIEKKQQRLKACKINTELQSKRAQELKLHNDLKARLAEVSKRNDDLDRVCANFASGLTIQDRDQLRLDNAKEMYQIGKKLTGIRFDYSAPPSMVKGYIKSEVRRTLTPFEMEASDDVSEVLWALVQSGDKENAKPHN